MHTICSSFYGRLPQTKPTGRWFVTCAIPFLLVPNLVVGSVKKKSPIILRLVYIWLERNPPAVSYRCKIDSELIQPSKKLRR